MLAALLPRPSGGLRVVKIALSLVAGYAQALSMAWPQGLSAPWLEALGCRAGQGFWLLQLLSLCLLAYLLQSARRSAQSAGLEQAWSTPALTYGYLFALAWLGSVFGWTFVAMNTYGGLSAAVSALAVLALAAFLGMYYAAACAIYVRLAPDKASYQAIFFAALWLLAELARGLWLTGFGWGGAAYAHADSPLAGYAPWLGAYGLCALAAWIAMLLAQIFHSRSWHFSGAALLGIGCVLFLPMVGSWLLPAMSSSNGRLSVTLLQGNIAQDQKFEPGSGVPRALQWYGEQLQQAKTDLVLAPETAIPLLPQQLPEGYAAALSRRFSDGEQAALIGIPLGDLEQGYTNSVLGLRPGEPVPWRYDKHHLVPFGEFIPTGFRWFTQLMNIPLGDFTRGALGQAGFAWRGQRLAPNICYEDLFGEELAQQFLVAAKAPSIFVNVSNLAWFGGSLAMDQHLQIARLRALEFHRPFLLATNTGLTAIVDHQARVLSQLPRDTAAVLIGEVEGRTGTTPYAWWVARFGLWPYWLAATIVLLWRWRQDQMRRQTGTRSAAERP